MGDNGDSRIPIIGKTQAPIIGLKTDRQGIAAVETLLEALKKGEAVNVAFVSEMTNGDMSIIVSPGFGNLIKLLGGFEIIKRNVTDMIVNMQRGR